MLPVNILYKAAQECCNLDRTARNIANVTYINYFGNMVPSKAQGNKKAQKPEEFAPNLVFLWNFNIFKSSPQSKTSKDIVWASFNA